MTVRPARLPVLFINLDRAAERRSLMERQAGALGIELERFAALTPAEITDDDRRLGRTWERPLTDAELALFLSHRALWERAARCPDGLVILEDDAVLSHRFAAFLETRPVGWDLCNLESFDRRKFFERRASVDLGPCRLSAVARDKSGSAAYFVSATGAERLLRASRGRAAPADAFLFSGARLRIAQAEPALAVQAHILRRLGVDRGIDTATQIHQPRAGLPLRPRMAAFHMRRAWMQVALLRFHLGRLGRLAFRKPELRLADFIEDEGPHPGLSRPRDPGAGHPLRP